MDNTPKLGLTHPDCKLCAAQGTANPQWPRLAPIVVDIEMMKTLQPKWLTPTPSTTSLSSDAAPTSPPPYLDVTPQPPPLPKPAKTRPTRPVVRETVKSRQAKQVNLYRLEDLKRMEHQEVWYKAAPPAPSPIRDVKPQPPTCRRPTTTRPALPVVREPEKSRNAKQIKLGTLEALEGIERWHRAVPTTPPPVRKLTQQTSTNAEPGRTAPEQPVVRQTMKSRQAKQANRDRLERLERMEACHRLPCSPVKAKPKPSVVPQEFRKTEGSAKKGREATTRVKKGRLPSVGNKPKSRPPWY